MSKARTTRLLGILIKLLERDKIQGRELEKAFGVSSRTIVRDIRRLNELGLPVSSQPGREGGYYLNDSAHHSLQYLSIDDLLEIKSKIAGRDKAQEQDIDTALAHLYEALPAPQGQNLLAEVEFSISPSGLERSLLEKLQWFYHCKERARLVKIILGEKASHKSVKKVYPLEIYYYRRDWLLYCFLPEKQNYSHYHFSSILSYKQLAQEMNNLAKKVREDDFRQYLRRKGIDDLTKLVLEIEGAPQYLAELKEKELFYQAEYKDKLQPGENNTKSRLILKTEQQDTEELLQIFLSFGSKLKIISPDWLSSLLLQEVQEIKEQYE